MEDGDPDSRPLQVVRVKDEPQYVYPEQVFIEIEVEPVSCAAECARVKEEPEWDSTSASEREDAPAHAAGSPPPRRAATGTLNGASVPSGPRVSTQITNKPKKTRKNDVLSREPTTREPVTCDTCHKQFSRQRNLNMHKRIHTGEKPYSCDICKKQFRDWSNYKNHERIHTGDKPYACEICAREFANWSNLRNHQQVHSGLRPHACEVCARRFARSSNLKKHRHIHTGLKPYQCDVCERRFTESSHLSRHRRTHSGARPSSCSHSASSLRQQQRPHPA